MQSSSRSQFKRPESILLVTYTRQGQTLLLRRVGHHTFWQSITGSIHWSGECPTEAAVRELKEETGIEVCVDEIRDWNRRFRFVIPSYVRHRYEPGVEMNVEHMFSVCLPQTVSVTLKPDEHSDHDWLDFESAMNKVWSWTNREALRLVHEMLLEGARDS